MRLGAAGVGKTFAGNPVLEAITFDVPSGTRAALVGPSGSGKTTLLRLLAGFELLDAGEISLGDEVVARAGGTSLPSHRRGIGYVAQDGALFPHRTVAGNIGFGLRRGNARAARVQEVMRLVDLDPALAARYPHQLSGGQQQRVAVARALAPAPGVILLDEPFSALDTGLREHTRAGVTAVLERAGVTTILVTHDQDEALSFGQSIGVLSAGSLVQWGEPGAVFDNPATAEVAEFLGAAVLLSAQRSGAHLECALGRLPIRHDHAPGVADVRAMIRPDQITVAPRSGVAGTEAVVNDIQPRGGHADIVVTVKDRPDGSLRVRLPAHLRAHIRPGDSVTLAVEGGAVAYPRS